MGLYDSIQTNLGNAFSGSLADAVQSCSYIDVDEVYDPITGGTVATKTLYVTRAVFSYYKSSEVGASEGTIKTNDRRVIILDSELDYKLLKVNDEIDLSGEILTVINFSRDPAKASITLQCRSNSL